MIRLILPSLTLMVLVGCATPPREYTDPRPIPTAEEVAGFGRIGIAAARAASPRKPSAPDSMSNLEKAGATAGVGALGAGYGAVMGLTCGPFAVICVPAFAIAGGATGLATGAVISLSHPTEEQVNSADITLRNTLLSMDVEDRLIETVLVRTSKNPGRNLRRVAYSREANSWDIGDVDGEVDTRILITVSKLALVALKPGQTRNPDVRLEVVVEGRIFEGERETPTFERRWLYDSEVRDYFDWADDEGILVVTEINRAIAVLGAQIATDFLEGRQEARRQPRDEQMQRAIAALEEHEEGAQRPSVESPASVPPASRAEARVTSTPNLRVAVFPFAAGPKPGYIAEGELTDHAHQFVKRRRDMELVYSAYDDDFDPAAVGAARSLWTGGLVSKRPNESNVYRAAAALDADLVCMFFFNKRTGGHYSDDLYVFDLYLLDVRKRRMYRASGDERSVRKVLESLFWQLETGRTAT